jgi:hypothetical protein
MLTADLTRLYAELYHMAAADSWPSIARHGLLCTRDLVDAWQVESRATRAALLEQRRPQSMVVELPEFGAATIRDHGPLNTASLADRYGGSLRCVTSCRDRPSRVALPNRSLTLPGATLREVPPHLAERVDRAHSPVECPTRLAQRPQRERGAFERIVVRSV